MPTILLELKTEEFGIRDGSSHQQIVELLAGRVLDSFRCRLLFALDSILETQMNCPGCAACADFTPMLKSYVAYARIAAMSPFTDADLVRLQSFAEHLREA